MKNLIFRYPSSSVHSTDDIIEDLSRDLFIDLSFQDEVGAEERELAVESFGLQNPWNSKVKEDALLELKSQHIVSTIYFNILGVFQARSARYLQSIYSFISF